MATRYFQKLFLAIALCSAGIILSYYIFLRENSATVPHVTTITRHLKLFAGSNHQKPNTSSEGDDYDHEDSVSVTLKTEANRSYKNSTQHGDSNEITQPGIVVRPTHNIPNQTQHSLATVRDGSSLQGEAKDNSAVVIAGALKDNRAPEGAVLNNVLPGGAIQRNPPTERSPKSNIALEADKPNLLPQGAVQRNVSPEGALRNNPSQVGVIKSSVLSMSDVKNNLSRQMAVTSKPKTSCTPRLAATMMKKLSSKFDENIPVFLSPGFQNWGNKLMEYNPPFGLRSQVPTVTSLLSRLTDHRSPRELLNINGCMRCVIVGSGGILSGKGLGRVIDGYDAVFRLNTAPVDGYELDVGSRTTMRVAYPEGTSRNLYEPGSLYGLVSFKLQDFQWLDSVLSGQQPTMSGFWKSVPYSLSKKPSEVRLVNPLLVREASFDLIGFPVNNGVMKKNTPTTGTMLISMAVRLCDEVDVVGFGYDLNRPSLPIHYYESVSMSVISGHYTHDVPLEKQYLKKLVDNGVIKDLTGGIHW